MGRLKDLTGMTFGRWKVIKRAGTNKHRNATWLCECSCEQHTKRIVSGGSLISGESTSCGCLSKEAHYKHGLSGTRLYWIWYGMKDRITNENNNAYNYYGGRGIKLCEQWFDYINFYNWAINNGYQENLTIERKNTNGDYCPENCCWATMKEQSLNKRNTHLLEFNGKIQSAKEWSEELNIPYYVLMGRINKYEWSTEKALTTPVKRRSKNG